jgi:2-polyprenyl-3-methyl-5-hydroxy-6-metoxy-1,4-benzoquinol methylase
MTPDFIKEKATLQELIEWDVRNWSKALDYWLAHTTQRLAGCSALELGSRNGGLSLWLALQGSRIVCSDVSMPTNRAIELHNRHAVSHLVRYESINALSIPYTMEFDVVVFKSMLGAVGRGGAKESQARAIMEIHKSLKKGGELFFAENLIGCSLHRFLRRKFVKWASDWRYVSLEEMEEFLAPFARVQYTTIGFAGVLGRTESERNIFGLLDQEIFNHIVPDGWRYITIGVAKKE